MGSVRRQGGKAKGLGVKREAKVELKLEKPHKKLDLWNLAMQLVTDVSRI
jgi:hypothetical protein